MFAGGAECNSIIGQGCDCGSQSTQEARDQYCQILYGEGVTCQKVRPSWSDSYTETGGSPLTEDGMIWRCTKPCNQVLQDVTFASTFQRNGDHSAMSQSYFNRHYNHSLISGTAWTGPNDAECDTVGIPWGYTEATAPHWCMRDCRVVFQNVQIYEKNCNGEIKLKPAYYPGGQEGRILDFTEYKWRCDSGSAGLRPVFTRQYTAATSAENWLGNAQCEKSTNNHDTTAHGTGDEWVACKCVSQTDSRFCSLGCKIPYDAGCYKEYNNLTAAGVEANWNYMSYLSGTNNIYCGDGNSASNAEYNESVGRTSAQATEMGRLLTIADLVWVSGDQNAARSVLSTIDETKNCWLPVDTSITSIGGSCRPRQSQEYCDETGCFNLGTSACSDNWWETGN